MDETIHHHFNWEKIALKVVICAAVIIGPGTTFLCVKEMCQGERDKTIAAEKAKTGPCMDAIYQLGCASTPIKCDHPQQEAIVNHAVVEFRCHKQSN